jgi:hypothetical protein
MPCFTWDPTGTLLTECSIFSGLSNSDADEYLSSNPSETLSSNGEATRTHQAEHQISNSEESIDREIHKLVKKHIDMKKSADNTELYLP